MPQNYTRTVNWTGANTGAGANYSWSEVSNSEAGWVSYSADSQNADAWIFQIADNTASNAVTRAATFRVQHHTYTDGVDTNTFDEFTITQYTDGTVTTTAQPSPTTVATNATTLATNATTVATNATTLATNATTLATNATTLATNPTAGTTLGTLGTNATTLATSATTLFSSIAWDNSTLSRDHNGFCALEYVSKEAGSSNGVGTMANYDASGGNGNLTQAGAMYWGSADGNTVLTEPSWIASVGVNDAWGSGSGTSVNQLRVDICIDAYGPTTTQATNATISPTR